MDDDVLGDCPSYRVLVTERGGLVFRGFLEFDTLYFSRVLDGVSAATILLGESRLLQCAELISELEPWRHEIVIVRNNEVVWQGPISDEIQYSTDSVSITCQDLLVWFNYRRVTLDRDYVQEDAGVIYRDLAVNALEADDSPNINIDVVATGTYLDRSYSSDVRQISYNAMQELHRTGIDVTVIGRDVRVSGENSPVMDLGTLPRGSYRGINIRKRGTDMANDLTVTASGSTGGSVISGTYSSAQYSPKDIADYGLLVGQTSNFIATTEETALAAARTRWEFTHKPAIYVQMTLQPWAPLPVSSIVPGSMLSLYDDATPLEISGKFRMTRADFQLVAGESGSQTEVAQIIVTSADTFAEAL